MVYSNRDDNSKRFKGRRYYLPKGIVKNYNLIINGKNFYDQPIDSDIKRYKEIRKLTIDQVEDYTSRSLFDYEYIKNHYILIAIWYWLKNNSANRIRWVIKNSDDVIVANESMFILTILDKIKETRLKFSQARVTVL